MGTSLLFHALDRLIVLICGWQVYVEKYNEVLLVHETARQFYFVTVYLPNMLLTGTRSIAGLQRLACDILWVMTLKMHRR